jgi:PAS domain S-box-containing protein
MSQPSLLHQNQLLNQEIKRRVDQISAINMVAASVGHSLDLDATLNTALEAVTTVLGAEAAGISLIDEQAQEVVLRAQLGWLNDFVKENPMRIPMGEGMSGDVITQNTVLINNNLTPDEEYAVNSFREEHFKSLAMAPMHARGKIIGILSIMSHRPNRFNEDLGEVLRSIADTVGVAIDNARLHEQHVENERRLNAILYSTADGILATDQNGRISLVNHAAAVMLDIDPRDLIGIPVREAQIQVNVREQLLQALADDDQARKNFTVPLVDGREIAVQVSPVKVTTQVTSDINDDGWVIVLQDITHIKEAEVARVQFIQAAAHDMKNPLSVTQKSIYMLESMIDMPDETMNEVIGIAQTGIGRVQKLIDDLLHIEKMESGYFISVEEIDVREMVFEITAQSMPLMYERNIELLLEIDEDTPTFVRLDRDWMNRALHNYLDNSAKYAPDGKVTCAVFPNEGYLHFEVRDTGPGIPLRAQVRLFDRFYRVDPSEQSVRGSGLGLAIVKSVAEAHDGSVYVQSEEGQGSTFGMMIPIR